MALDKILEYQTLFIERKRIERDIEKSPDAQRMEEARNKFNQMRADSTEIEALARKFVEDLGRQSPYFEETQALFAQLSAKIDSAEDVQAWTELVEQLSVVRNKLVEQERKLDDRRTKGAKLIEKLAILKENGDRVRKIFVDAKGRLAELQAERAPRLAVIETSLAQLRPNIEPQLLEMFDELASEMILPAFVPLRGSDTCGCGMQISQKTLAQLRETGRCRCDTCRRIVYKK